MKQEKPIKKSYKYLYNQALHEIKKLKERIVTLENDIEIYRELVKKEFEEFKNRQRK